MVFQNTIKSELNLQQNSMAKRIGEFWHLITVKALLSPLSIKPQISFKPLISFKPPSSLAFVVKQEKHAHLVGLLTSVMIVRFCALNTAHIKT